MSEDLERELLAAIQEQTAELRALRRAIAPTGTLTLEEAAHELGCSTRRVFELLKKRKLTRAKKVGKHTKVTATSVRALQELEARAPSANDRPAITAAEPQRGTRFRELAKLTAKNVDRKSGT